MRGLIEKHIGETHPTNQALPAHQLRLILRLQQEIEVDLDLVGASFHQAEDGCPHLARVKHEALRSLHVLPALHGRRKNKTSTTTGKSWTTRWGACQRQKAKRYKSICIYKYIYISIYIYVYIL